MKQKCGQMHKIVVMICILMGMLIGLSGLISQPLAVNAATKKASLNRSVATLEVGRTMRLKLKNVDSKAVKKTVWTSSNKSVATVSASGKVKAKKAGSVTITCKVTYSNKKKESLKCNITVRNKTSNFDSALGVWYSECYVDNHNSTYSYIEIYLYDDGTGKLNGYECADIPRDASVRVKDPESLRGVEYLTWTLEGNRLTISSGGEYYNYKYSKNKGTLVSEDGYVGYSRKRPPIPDGCTYMTRLYDLVADSESKKQALMSRLSGNWYFDLTIWTFNNDGTGVLYIPKVGNGKEQNRKFKYTVDDGGYDDIMFIDIKFLDNGKKYEYEAVLNKNGSMVLDDSIKLTRTFEIDNCPLTEKMIENNLKVITGDLVDEMLSGADK